MIDSQKIEMRVTPDNKIFCRSAKHEQEIVMHASGKGMCAPAQKDLPDAKIFVLADPLWWIESKGEWIAVEYERGIASK